ncbi:MAG TPA: ATP-binding protein [Blastocatellia bacterium]|nr:ATP-binding protein [Blastocatellia bacterium]
MRFRAGSDETFDEAGTLRLFRQQETTLALLNLAVIAALLLVHAAFISLLGLPSRWLVLALAARFLLLIVELIWLQRLTQPPSPALAAAWTHYSIWINIAFAFLAAHLGGAADTHYSVLMVLPVIAAAWRFSLPGTLAIAAVAIALTFLEVRLFFRSHPPAQTSEYFEAATVSLIFLVVALVVRLLVRNLRREELKLRESLAELRRTQDRLVAEEKLAAIGRLSSGIAHEIRNPVAMISSSLTMANQSSDAALRTEMFEIAAQEATRLERLTTEFLTYARGKEPERRRVKLGATLGYVVSLMKAQAAESNVALRLECPVEFEASVDDFQIQQALLNLLGNALDATPSGGRILIGGSVNERNELTLFVENSGERIPDEVAARIFEPFFSTKNKGTGLGLAIVRNIAQAHRGRAELTMNEPGRVRFSLIIPQSDLTGGADGAHSDHR